MLYEIIESFLFVMTNKAIDELKEYLKHECNDYGLSYDYIYNSDYEYFEVTVKKDYDFRNLETTIHIRYNEEDDSLEIELGEDSWYKTEWFNPSVKYFWMLIGPKLFN